MRFVFLTGLLALPACQIEPQAMFENSVGSNNLDFIRPSDPQTYACSRFTGTGTRQMPDPRRDELMADDDRLFEAFFTDGTMVPIWIHPDVPDPETRVAQLGPPLGHLPTAMRNDLNKVVVLDSDAAFAEDLGRFFVIGTERMDRRLADNDLEETVFHEAFHATLDIPNASDPDWLAAKQADGAVLTEYARNEREDMAEHALFALAVLRHPGRLPVRMEAQIRETIPNRLAFFQGMLDRGAWTVQVGPTPDCPR